MSKVDRMIELKPMRHDSHETLVSVGHRCEYCQGNDGTGVPMTSGKESRLPAQSVTERVNLMPSSTSHGNQPVKIRAYETEQGKIRCSNNNSGLRGKWPKML